MQQDKIEAALTAALKHIEEAMKAHACNDEKAMSNSLWLTSAEAEYAVFLLALLQDNKSNSAPLKQEVSAEQSTESESILTSAQQLLKSAKEKVQTGELMRGYEEAWTARNLLLRLQESLEKKRKKEKQK